MGSRWPRGAGAALLAGALLALPAVLPAVPAAAATARPAAPDPAPTSTDAAVPDAGPAAGTAASPAATGPAALAGARTTAARLRASLDDLGHRQEAAEQEYAAARDALDDAAAGEVGAARRADATEAAVRDTRADAGRAARALYMSGGTGLYATVLEAGSLSDAMDRMTAVEAVAAGRQALAALLARGLASAEAGRTATEAASDRRVLLLARADAARRRVAELEQRTRTELAGADATVRRLLAAERARAAREAAAASAARLAAAAQQPWTGSVEAPSDALAAMDRAFSAASADPATPWAAAAIADARRWIGTPYSAGGGGVAGPSTGWCSSSAPDDGRSGGRCLAAGTVGFDCSSLMVRVFSAAGLALPRTSRQQYWEGDHLSLDQARPGDLLFWAYSTGNPSSIHHVALYLGDGLMVHSPHTGDHVRVAKVYTNGLIGVTRPTGA